MCAYSLVIQKYKLIIIYENIQNKNIFMTLKSFKLDILNASSFKYDQN